MTDEEDRPPDLAAQLGARLRFRWRWSGACCDAHPGWELHLEGRADARGPYLLGPRLQRTSGLRVVSLGSAHATVEALRLTELASGDAVVDRWDAETRAYRRTLAAVSTSLDERRAARLARMARHAFEGHRLSNTGRPRGPVVSEPRIVALIIRLTRTQRRVPALDEVAQATDPRYESGRTLQRALGGPWSNLLWAAYVEVIEVLDLFGQGPFTVTSTVRQWLAPAADGVPDGGSVSLTPEAVADLRETARLLAQAYRRAAQRPHRMDKYS